MPTNTIRLHRVLRAAPEKVYRAFLDADAMAKWLPPNGFTGKVHHLEAKVGGTHKMSFTNFTTGQSHSFGGNVSRTGAARTHSLHRQIRRPESARGTSGHRNLEEGIGRDRVEHRAGRGARGHPARGLLSRLAGIAHALGQAGRSRYSGLTPGKNVRPIVMNTQAQLQQAFEELREGTFLKPAASWLWGDHRAFLPPWPTQIVRHGKCPGGAIVASQVEWPLNREYS